MHQTRSNVIRGLPLTRKGTTYVARALSRRRSAIPVVVAVRDLLKLAHTAKEVKLMVHKHLLRINDRVVRDMREPIVLGAIFTADKPYVLTVLPTGRFALTPTKEKTRVCKVIAKNLVSGGVSQYNLHDGTNIILKQPVAIGDSLVLGLDNTLTKHLSLAPKAHVMIISGSNIGKSGVVRTVDGKQVSIALADSTEEVVLDRKHVFVQ
jgi:small subunit ribosomal protein S4e